MSDWKRFRKHGTTEMRPHMPGEELIGVSVSDADLAEASGAGGGKIARNPDNHDDQWYVAKAYFETMYEEAEG